MYPTTSTLLATALVGVQSAFAGSVLWDGRFNSSTAADISAWSWSNQVGAYQYYIHGSGTQDAYVNIASDYKNTADTSSEDGVKITIDDTSYWNGQTMRRTELIPQTSAAINSGKVYYHFSIQHKATNPPSQTEEHQIGFFESHFTELKSGLLSGSSESSSNALHWMAGGVSQWNISDWTADVWHNVAYGIDFDAETVEFYHSTGADDLTLVVPAVSASTSSNGADWHLGILRLAGTTSDTDTEDFYFSGVYVESGDVTLTVSGPGGDASSASSSSAVSSTVATSSAAAASVSSTSVAAATTSSVEVVSTSSSVAVASSSAVVASSSVAVVSSAAAATTTAAAAVTSSSAVPTTLQTLVKSSAAASFEAPITTASATTSAAAAAASSTSEAAAASTTDADANCAVEYVYV